MSEPRETFDADDLRELHRMMAVLRFLEERVKELRLAEEVRGSVHLALGQEAVAVGACAALAPIDTLTATYRGHGWAAAKGVPVVAILAELLGKEIGTNGGRGGSAYLSSADHLFLGENSIVGAGAPIALGPALASRYDGSGRVSLTVFGDGAINQGSVSEAFNFAAAFALPVVFVCENNGLSELTRIDEMVADDQLWRRAGGFGLPGVRIDGNDPVAVRTAVREAVERARAGGGPSLVEAMTERIAGHYIGDHELYRRPGEVEAALTREPLVRSRQRLRELGVSDADVDDVERGARDEVDAATATARDAELSQSSTVREHMYVDH
ncbi:thiamine pyrophosphate-dependent dehydrogenase E1 component subunit alpha [Jiangella asiatica]|uniref:thiamine pyrophosphate-dependent dehydrogenase E1 component subunit alpha n=1 Tax=Jiangella asiatica TaxID=2530372 RepID=UPI001EEFC6F2|nr:thiamine pyrophosphate-dependent dehydrogenase E1 component subunit alpha [Jiangella asiatica]